MCCGPLSWGLAAGQGFCKALRTPAEASRTRQQKAAEDSRSNQKQSDAIRSGRRQGAAQYVRGLGTEALPRTARSCVRSPTREGRRRRGSDRPRLRTCTKQSEAVGSNWKQLEAIGSNQKQSEAIGSNRKQSEAIRSNLARPRPRTCMHEAARSNRKQPEAFRSIQKQQRLSRMSHKQSEAFRSNRRALRSTRGCLARATRAWSSSSS